MSETTSSAVPDDHGVVGGLGLTLLDVYDGRPAPDGMLSGCPHVHAVTTEAYFVVAGSGHVDLHDVANGFRTLPLMPYRFVQFGPGTLHRIVAADHLRVLALMSDAGFAERGDARIYFGPEVDDDTERFEKFKALPKTGGLDGALERRDHAVEAYVELLALWRADRDAYYHELRRFHALHRGAMGLTEDAPEAVSTSVRVWDGAIAPAPAPAARRGTVLGMCGWLSPLEQLAAA